MSEFAGDYPDHGRVPYEEAHQILEQARLQRAGSVEALRKLMTDEIAQTIEIESGVTWTAYTSSLDDDTPDNKEILLMHIGEPPGEDGRPHPDATLRMVSNGHVEFAEGVRGHGGSYTPSGALYLVEDVWLPSYGHTGSLPVRRLDMHETDDDLVLRKRQPEKPVVFEADINTLTCSASPLRPPKRDNLSMRASPMQRDVSVIPSDTLQYIDDVLRGGNELFAEAKHNQATASGHQKMRKRMRWLNHLAFYF